MSDTPNTTNETDRLTQLKALMASFTATELKAAMKTLEANKPTNLSVTMDAIVAAQLANNTTTKAVADDATRRGRECGLFSGNEEATQSSVAQLIRHVKAHDDAMTRAGYEWTRKAEPAPDPQVAKLTEGGMPQDMAERIVAERGPVQPGDNDQPVVTMLPHRTPAKTGKAA
jgi:hypothetical protein